MPVTFEQKENREVAGSVRARELKLMDEYEDMLPQLRARAFAVSGIEDMKQLARIREAIARVPEGGDWKEARKQIAEELGGQQHRAETVLRTNCFEAYAAARYRRQQIDKDVMPYLVYHTVGDDRVRRDHAALDGLVLPADDPFWETHYPPWDWGCRCTVSGMTQLEYDEEKAAADAGEDTAFKFPTQENLARIPGAAQGGFSFNPKDLVPQLDEIAKRDYAEPEALRTFIEKADDARIELPDGSTTTTLRMMTPEGSPWQKARSEALSDCLARSLKDREEHVVALDRLTSEPIPGVEKRSEEDPEHEVGVEWDALEGRTVGIFHSHPIGSEMLSPTDILQGMRDNVKEVGAISFTGTMCAKVRKADEGTREELARLALRMKNARKRGDVEACRKRAHEWIERFFEMTASGIIEITERTTTK